MNETSAITNTAEAKDPNGFNVLLDEVTFFTRVKFADGKWSDWSAKRRVWRFRGEDALPGNDDDVLTTRSGTTFTIMRRGERTMPRLP